MPFTKQATAQAPDAVAASESGKAIVSEDDVKNFAGIEEQLKKVSNSQLVLVVEETWTNKATNKAFMSECFEKNGLRKQGLPIKGSGKDDALTRSDINNLFLNID